MDSTTNALNWFEIPAIDIERSKKFYETIFDIEMTLMDMGDEKLAMFPFEPGTGKASGAIASGEYHKPSDKGTYVYLNANPAMDNVLEKVEAAATAAAELIREKLDGTEITIEANAGQEGKLFGSVSNQEIADALNEQGFRLTRKQTLPGNCKTRVLQICFR